jgi:hypothetical protein
LVYGVNVILFNQALSQTQRHGRVIGPLTGFEMKHAASHHIFDGLKRARGTEFHCCSQGVAYSQAQYPPLYRLKGSGFMVIPFQSFSNRLGAAFSPFLFQFQGF